MSLLPCSGPQKPFLGVPAPSHFPSPRVGAPLRPKLRVGSGGSPKVVVGGGEWRTDSRPCPSKL